MDIIIKHEVEIQEESLISDSEELTLLDETKLGIKYEDNTRLPSRNWYY